MLMLSKEELDWLAGQILMRKTVQREGGSRPINEK